MSIERIRRDRVAHEALTERADPQHLAVAGRQPGQENPARLMRGFSGRAGTTVAHDQALTLSTGHTRPAPHRASWRLVPVDRAEA